VDGASWQQLLCEEVVSCSAIRLSAALPTLSFLLDKTSAQISNIYLNYKGANKM